MGKYWLKRVGWSALTLTVVASLTFFLMKMLPGTPFNNPRLPAGQIAQLQAQYGLDQPVWRQYLTYIANLLHGDLGVSYQFSGQPVAHLIAGRLAPTLQLGVQALVVGTSLGLLLGAVAAWRQNSWIDATATIFAVLGRSVPSFVFAALLQFVVAIKAGLLPVALWEDGWASSVLPTLALAIAPLANTARFMRTELVAVLASDYVSFARAKGAGTWQVVVHHALRNAMVPVVTMIGPMAVDLMVGSLVVENIFAVPGIGEQFVKAIMANDYPVIMGLTLMYSALLTVVMMVVDGLTAWLDPRIRLDERER